MIAAIKNDNNDTSKHEDEEEDQFEKVISYSYQSKFFVYYLSAV